AGPHRLQAQCDGARIEFAAVGEVWQGSRQSTFEKALRGRQALAPLATVHLADDLLADTRQNQVAGLVFGEAEAAQMGSQRALKRCFPTKWLSYTPHAPRIRIADSRLL